ncbi:RBR-type E3 ubiquitin transferase [Coniochaeta hoffmannii]|uniref:RBR-type E3 ubiquitin transferase n=1 Tax=Coniochaeta hoffmannii TaxID=91930 RepID=A0AA38SMW3_9PEZI|nr:RBR-type E3 ubiquitin transferase [Coniochaeta hoffmannii]
MVPMDMDSETLSVALRLQSGDLDELKDQKGKGREGDASHSRLAVELYQIELATREQFLSDLVLSRSIAQAVGSDAELIQGLASEEQQAAHDRGIAMAIDAGTCAAEPPVQDDATAPTTPDSAVLERLAAMNDYAAVNPDSLMSDATPDEAESSAWAATRSTHPRPPCPPQPERETFDKCDSCQDMFRTDSLAHCSCSHNYCRECLAALFQSSLADEGRFPPRCCRQEIPANPQYLPPQLIGQFRAKQLEYGCKDRTYCHGPTCSTFVPPQFVRGDVAICVKCSRRTCVKCKGPVHDRECPDDIEAREVLRVAAENGWQRCHSCGRLVELLQGCNHMTCSCRAEFCYVCGRQWKTCACDVWDEARLMAQANDRVDRNAQARQPVNAQARAVMLERARHDILENHECDHERWKSRPGPEECDHCGQLLPIFIYECRQCEMLACRACRRHRL